VNLTVDPLGSNILTQLSWPLTYEAMTLKINRVSVILRTKYRYVPSFVKNPLKDVDSSVHKDVMR
jgi:hypothetical protein